MIGPLHAAMTATLLAIRIEIADFHALAITVLPIDRNIVFVHDYTFSQRRGSPGAGASKKLFKCHDLTHTLTFPKRHGPCDQVQPSC